jgi:hypothetical protein
MRTYSSALAAVRVKRGSTTIILQPVSLACSMCSMLTGCASAALEPMYNAPCCSACRCTSWSSRRNPRCWPRRPPWWSGRCAPGGRSCCCPRSSRTCAAGRPARCCAWTSRPRRRIRPAGLAQLQHLRADLVQRLTSQLMRWYLPFTSFIGYLRRYSPWPCSRTEAPLAQCAPRLMGESNTGSCRTQTPFSTTASTAQPTEQWPHTVRRDLDLLKGVHLGTVLHMRTNIARPFHPGKGGLREVVSPGRTTATRGNS